MSDIASGLNEDRSGLFKLFDMVEKYLVVVEFRDRLTRFGFEYLERYFNFSRASSTRSEIAVSPIEILWSANASISTAFANRIKASISILFEELSTGGCS